MQQDITPSAFFKEKAREESFMKGLLRLDAPVWTVLDHLKEAISNNIRPNLPDVIEPMMPVSAPVVILPDGCLSQGFELRLVEKGKARVIVQGEPVEGASIILPGAVFQDRMVQIGQGVIIESTAFIKGPTIIMDRTEVRHGAYIRGDCYFGRGCVVGHTTEVKHSIFLAGAKAGHFAYIGDSILGSGVNLGAGTKLANLRLDGKNISFVIDGKKMDTGRRKLGAILGDGVQTGCNSVTNPGALLGPSSLVAPNATVRPGVYGRRSIIRETT